jgi:hypothetical protein
MAIMMPPAAVARSETAQLRQSATPSRRGWPQAHPLADVTVATVVEVLVEVEMDVVGGDFAGTSSRTHGNSAAWSFSPQ